MNAQVTHTPDLSHLDALRLGLSHERERLAAAKNPQERALRAVWVEQMAREVAAELKFLGISESLSIDMTDDDLLDALLTADTGENP